MISIFDSDPRRHESTGRLFSSKPGVVVSFDSPIYINGRFTGFDGWNMTNDKFKATNISYIVRVEFAHSGKAIYSRFANNIDANDKWKQE